MRRAANNQLSDVEHWRSSSVHTCWAMVRVRAAVGGWRRRGPVCGRVLCTSIMYHSPYIHNESVHLWYDSFLALLGSPGRFTMQICLQCHLHVTIWDVCNMQNCAQHQIGRTSFLFTTRLRMSRVCPWLDWFLVTFLIGIVEFVVIDWW